MATKKQWNKSMNAFNSNPLSLEDILDILKDYYREEERGGSYFFSKSVGDQLIKKYPALPYALYHHHFFIDYDPRNVGEEYWIELIK